MTWEDYEKLNKERAPREGRSAKTPDTSFCFKNLKEIPDLAIEVVFSSGVTEDLKKYQNLGVKEVWFWMKNKLDIYILVNGI